MITSSTAPSSIPARRTASRITSAPSFGAGSGERPPRYLPIGVRQALRMTGVVSSRDMRSQGQESGSVGAQHAAPLRSHRFKFTCQFILTRPAPACEPLPAASPRNRQWTALSACPLLPVPAPRPSPPRPRAAPPPPCRGLSAARGRRSEEHTSELQSQSNLVCRLLLEKKKKHFFIAHLISF